MNQVLSEILKTGFVKSSNGEAVRLHSHIPQLEGEFLQKLVIQYKPRISLEVGLAYGVSSLFICEALSKVQAERHIVIDPYQFSGWEGIGLRNLREAGYEKLVEFKDLSSHLVLPQLETQGLKIDFAFIDGWHTFDYALMDFFYIDRLLRVGGVVVFDDTLYPSVRKVCRYIVTNRAYTVIPDESSIKPPKRSLKNRVARTLPILRTYFKRIAKPETLNPDHMLGLPPDNYVAFRKERDDVLGDGSNGTRRWDLHNEF